MIGRPKAVRATILLLAALLPAGCQAPLHETNWNRLRVGMSQAEVASMLGSPSSTYAPPASDPKDAAVPGDQAPPSRGERWQYGDTMSSLATRAVFPDEADERAWCVFFGADGRVTGFRAPAWADARSSQEP